MTDDSPRASGSALSLTISVSTQPAFVPTVEALAARAGQYVGCPADDARHLGEALARALREVVGRLGPGGVPSRFDIVFLGNGRLLKVDLACPVPLPSGVTLEEALGGTEGVDGLRRLVDRVEFGDADGCPFCRLTRQIREPR